MWTSSNSEGSSGIERSSPFLPSSQVGGGRWEVGDPCPQSFSVIRGRSPSRRFSGGHLPRTHPHSPLPREERGGRREEGGGPRSPPNCSPLRGWGCAAGKSVSPKLQRHPWPWQRTQPQGGAGPSRRPGPRRTVALAQRGNDKVEAELVVAVEAGKYNNGKKRFESARQRVRSRAERCR